jgi:pimeloyl-ACP methyl ester carboxylesterase
MVRGLAPRFVLVRGLAREARHWHEFDRGLEHRFLGCVVERHDLPGNGSRFRETSPIDAAAMAAELRASVWARSDQPIVLISISLGAMVCLEWLRWWPGDPIVGLAVINTSAGGICRPWERLRPRALISTLLATIERDPVQRELDVLALTSSVHRNDRALARVHAEFQRDQPIRRRNVARQLCAAARFRLDRAPSTTPIVVLSSARDRMVNSCCSAKLARALKATLVVHPKAGHDLTLDDPRWCAEQIGAWVGEIDN